MKTTGIQLNDMSLRQAEDFIAGICDDNHLDNYHATIAVPVLKAVEIIIQSGSNQSVAPTINLKSEYTPKGIAFTVSSRYSCFPSSLANSSLDSLPESYCLFQLLADQVEVLDDGKSICMTFFVRGIDEQESVRRMSVLNHFYSPVLVEV